MNFRVALGLREGTALRVQEDMNMASASLGNEHFEAFEREAITSEGLHLEHLCVCVCVCVGCRSREGLPSAQYAHS